MPWGNISIFATFGGHLGFQWKMKKCNYPKIVREKFQAIFDPQSSRRVSYADGINFNFTTFGGHLGF